MFEKILIANRGEIACRIIHTAKKMGISTVAVYSEVDKGSKHVRLADESIALGGVTAIDSYLQIEKIIAACEQVRADAVHPGYGFLSENASFSEALKSSKITFIGPPASSIAKMGDKIESKKIAKLAGVSTVPGHEGIISLADNPAKIASEIGYPIMIKASAGGGGKGMRLAHSPDQLVNAISSATREAEASFGDKRVFIEKYIENPRHIEIQILADKFGNFIHLNERECSIQRRNQKIIEEAPSPFLDRNIRQAMAEEAIRLGKAVKFYSAGTVEFIVDEQRNFFFLEMNTRLQVEHPVTELISGIDLVEEMIMIAADKPLRYTQKDIKIDGWAIENRIYAEDPYRNFLPATGRLTLFNPPDERNFCDDTIIRNDTGVEEGDAISIYYDPLIAKLCSWGKTRDSAIKRMQLALDEFTIRGIGNNISFLSAVMEHERFINGKTTTGFIDQEFQGGFVGVNAQDLRKQHLGMIVAGISFLDTLKQKHTASNLAHPSRESESDEHIVQFLNPLDGQLEQEDNLCLKIRDHNGGLQIECNQKRQTFVQIKIAAHHPQIVADLVTDGHEVQYICEVWRNKDRWHIHYRGVNLCAHIRPPRIAQLAHHMKPKKNLDDFDKLICPMPGNLIKIFVSNGEIVEAGQALCIIEAMKMENTLVSKKRCKINKIMVKEGVILSVDETIMMFSDVS